MRSDLIESIQLLGEKLISLASQLEVDTCQEDPVDIIQVDLKKIESLSKSLEAEKRNVFDIV